jgi:hypothetical protein
MAQTSAAVQAELGTNGTNAIIVRAEKDASFQYWYVLGNVPASGRSRWVRTTESDDAATQAAAILTGLRA